MSLYYCLNCGSIYDDRPKMKFSDPDYGDSYECPNLVCKDVMIEVDEQILPVIKILNNKGYSTVGSCSGHCYDNDTIPYIEFEKGISLPSVPAGWRLNKFLYDRFKIYNMETISILDKLDKLESLEVPEEIMSVQAALEINIEMNKLILWALQLPNYYETWEPITPESLNKEKLNPTNDTSCNNSQELLNKEDSQDDFQNWTREELKELENVEDRSKQCIIQKK